MSKCELCGGYGGHRADGYDKYRIPPEWDTLCTDCAESVNTHSVDDMTEDELIAAIVDDSIGYASPAHAAKHVQQFQDGERAAYCERASATFPMDVETIEELDDVDPVYAHPGDLHALMESARAHWMLMSDDKRKSVLETVEAWRQSDEPTGFSAFSMLYPTHGPA